MWLIAFIIGFLVASLFCCLCFTCLQKYCLQQCSSSKQQQEHIVTDDWQSETDETSNSHVVSSTLRGVLQNIIKPALLQFLCCCVFKKRNKQRQMPHPLAHVDGAVEVPTYEAPVPTILNEETTTQIYNLCKCKVTVIANSNVMQIFKLNNSGMSFMDKGKFIYETKIT